MKALYQQIENTTLNILIHKLVPALGAGCIAKPPSPWAIIREGSLSHLAGTEAVIWVTFLRLPGVGSELQGPRHQVAQGRPLADWLGCSRLAALLLTLPRSLPAARPDSGSWGGGVMVSLLAFGAQGGRGPAWGIVLHGHRQDGPLVAQPSPQQAGSGVGLTSVFPRQGGGHSRSPIQVLRGI